MQLRSVGGPVCLPIVHVTLDVLAQQRLLIECTVAHIAAIPEVRVRAHVSGQLGDLHERFVALGALVRKDAVRFHVLRQMGLLLERFVGAQRTGEAAHAAVHEQVLIERRDLREFLRALRADVLLDLVVRLHVIVEVGDLREGATARRLDADERPFAGVQSPVVVEVGDLRERFAAVAANEGALIAMDALVVAQIGGLRESCGMWNGLRDCLLWFLFWILLPFWQNEQTNFLSTA